ncbi:hypothetical protein LCGC14_2776980, partial [marine sediment metagenome]
GGTWTHVSALDLRGVSPAGAVGGSTGLVSTEFADNAFRIFDEGDVTKVIAFQASGIMTGNTRTVAAEDGPMTIPLTSEWDDLTDAGATTLHKHDHGGQDGLGDDDHTIYILADGSRAFSGDVDFGGNLIDNAPFLRGYIDGLTTELDTDALHDVQVNPGACTDSLANNDKIIEVTGAFTKRIDAAWAVGDTNGGMATGSVAADTEYNLIIIEKDSDGTIDMMFDVSATGANVPAGYTSRRRIGSVFTDGSADILAYAQTGDWFIYDAAVSDVVDATGTLSVFETGTLSVPASSLTMVILFAQVTDAHEVGSAIRRAGATSAASSNNVSVGGASDATMNLVTIFLTAVDGSSQVNYTLSGSGVGVAWNLIIITTLGWLDLRGRNE